MKEVYSLAWSLADIHKQISTPRPKIPSACLIFVSDAYAVSTSFQHRSCRQPRRKL